MENLTNKQALETIGQVLALDILKLTQKEHLLLIECFNKLKELVDKEENDTTRN
jgi:hypothetical protein